MTKQCSSHNSPVETKQPVSRFKRYYENNKERVRAKQRARYIVRRRLEYHSAALALRTSKSYNNTYVQFYISYYEKKLGKPQNS